MKVTIKGKRYDTKSAHLLVSIDDSADLAIDIPKSLHWKCAMYATKRSKKFFLAGKGGSLTVFRGREGIIPLTDEEAMDVAEYSNDDATRKDVPFLIGERKNGRKD